VSESNEIYYTLNDTAKILESSSKQIISYARSGLCKLSLRRGIMVNKLGSGYRDCFDDPNESINPDMYEWDIPTYIQGNFTLLEGSLFGLFNEDKATITFLEIGDQIYIVEGTRNQSAEQYEGEIDVYIDDIEISKTELNTLRKSLKEIDWEEKYYSLKNKSDTIITDKDKEIEELKASLQKPINKSAETKKYNYCVKIIAGIAIQKYHYDKTKSKNSAAANIADTLLKEGIRIDENTILDKIRDGIISIEEDAK